jgi:hypothetical protein
MRYKFLYFILIFIAFACKNQENNVQNSSSDYLIFGIGYGHCIGNCSHYYQIKDNKIYEDNTLMAYDSIIFNINPLSNDKYYLSKTLLVNLPEFLKSKKDSTIGCPDCADQGRIYIELYKNGSISKWNIDTNPNTHPKEIKTYLSQLKEILNMLE